MELEEDLDKVRSAGDFQDSSLPILVTALKQGEAIFSGDEKARIMAL
jgi:ribosome assembly protein 3